MTARSPSVPARGIEDPRKAISLTVPRAKERDELIGVSTAIAALVGRIERLAQDAHMTVLVTGPTGSGKEVAARHLHRLTTPGAPFEAFHCSGHPATLLESHLFGHERGAFTDAVARQAGACELAGSGTLFLDEIGTMPLDQQAKLLRMIDDRRYRRVGATTDQVVDARIVAATNEDLEQLVRDGLFRQDLFFRLSVVTLRMPSLDHRRVDIPTLVQSFAQESGAPDAFAADTIEALTTRPWPGNVRELLNTVRATMTLVQRRPITPADLDEHMPIASNGQDNGMYMGIAARIFDLGPPYDERLQQVSGALLVKALAKCNGNKRELARLFKVPWSTMRGRIRAMETRKRVT
jgi:DNA-binding NtrC family response regulator